MNKLFCILLTAATFLAFTGCQKLSVAGVWINSAITVEIGESRPLVANIQPEDAHNKAVSWKSDDPGIATVDATGLVTGIAPGRVIVTVTTKEGGYTSECEVHVLDPDLFVVIDDDAFLAFCQAQTTWDTDRDGRLSPHEVSVVTHLDVDGGYDGEKIASLEWISYFTGLTTLYCDNNSLTTLDLSKNTALTTLYCVSNSLTSLDVSGCSALTMLQCERNSLASLDISKNTALTYFDCSRNPGSNGTFVVKAWFDNAAIPSSNFTKGTWLNSGATITIDYQKVN